MKVGWIGTGIMGSLMAGRILSDEHELYVFSRTKSKAESLTADGAQWCSSPAEVTAHSDIVFSMVRLPTDVEKVYLGDEGILSAKGDCRIAVDMSTSQPMLAKILAEKLKSRGMECLDAPVSGGPMGAKVGKLAIMVGGNKDFYDEVMPLFKLMGSTIAHMGRRGRSANQNVQSNCPVGSIA